MLKRIWYFRRSLLLQLALLSILVVAIIFIQAVIIPFMEATQQLEPIEVTRNQLIAELTEEVNKENPNFELVNNLEIFKDIAAVNPEMRYFVEYGEVIAQYGADPLRIGIGITDSELQNGNGDTQIQFPGAFASVAFIDDGLPGRAVYNNFPGREYYIEIAGITTPIDTDSSLLWRFIEGFSFDQLVGIFPGFGWLILLVAIILVQALFSLQKVAKIAEKINLDKKRVEIPEKGLPIEIRPLVRALNEMLARVEQAHEKQAFFLAAAAHEIRTPMTILRTRIEEIENGSTKENLIKDVRRLSRLVEQLLQLTRYKADHELNTENVNLPQLLRKLIASRAPLAIEKDVDILLRADNENLSVMGDADMLSIAILNLIDNAISFSDRGDNIIVELGDDCSINVSDEGPGVPPENQKKLFDPFSKNPPNRDGFGLGLAIVNAIMVIHKGKVIHSNRLEKGSTFSLVFDSKLKLSPN